MCVCVCVCGCAYAYTSRYSMCKRVCMSHICPLCVCVCVCVCVSACSVRECVHVCHVYAHLRSIFCTSLSTYMCDVANSYMWCDAFIYAFMFVTQRIYTCYIYEFATSIVFNICVTWWIHICDVTHSYTHAYLWHDAWTYVTLFVMGTAALYKVCSTGLR